MRCPDLRLGLLGCGRIGPNLAGAVFEATVPDVTDVGPVRENVGP
jgi:hypothetical protein